MSPERRYRLVDRLVLHEGPMDFAALAGRVIPNSTRFLILDLDRTLHLGRNMGELLGWEIAALRAFGQEQLASMEPRRETGRLAFDPRSLAGSLRYLWHGGRTWARPGLYYFLCGKLPEKHDLLRAWTYRRFGPEPVRVVQRVPQDTMLELLSEIPDEVARELAERVWDRHAPDQVIRREDLDALRARCPGLRIVITSASPRVVVEVARDRLGADHAECSEPGRINSGPAKITRLAARFPDALRPETESVGITDTGYGEDHCWAQHLTRVVDVNSDSPFSPFVETTSPLEAVHSAQLLTNLERQRRAEGQPGWLDDRRASGPRTVGRAFTGLELSSRLSDRAQLLEAACQDRVGNAWHIARLKRDSRRELEHAPRAPGADAPDLRAPSLEI